MHLRTRLALSFVMAVALALTLPFGLGCKKEAPPPGAVWKPPTLPPAETEVVRIGYLDIVGSLPLFVAQDKGYFEEEGVEVALVPAASSNELVDALVAGDVDCFIMASIVPVIASHLADPGKIKAFAAAEITEEAPFDALLVPAESEASELADLAGLKIGVFPGSTATTLLRAHLEEQEVDTSDITFVELIPAEQLAALDDGDVDALHAYEPLTALAVAEGTARTLGGSVYAAMLSPCPQGLAAVSATLADDRPEEAAKVIAALERGMQALRDDEGGARKIATEGMDLPEEAADTFVLPYMLPINEMGVDVLQQYADLLLELGEIDEAVAATELVYEEPADHPEAGAGPSE